MPDTIGQLRPLPSADAEALAEEFIDSATKAESVSEDAEDEVSIDEDGGPFIVLDDEGRLPSELAELAELSPEGEGEGKAEVEVEVEGEASVERQEARRGARWAARGA